MSNPFTIGECGHTFCRYAVVPSCWDATLFRDCVCAVLKEQCACPTCHMPIYVRNLKRSPQYSSIVTDIGKLGDAIRQCNTGIAKENRGVGNAVERRSKKSIAKEGVSTTRIAKAASSGKKQRLASPRLSPITAASHASMHIACTSLSVDQKKILHSFAIYAGKVELVEVIAANTTHLITCTSKSSGGVEKDALLAPRTMKYMLAILRGIPVISFDWVLESIAASRWLEHAIFLVRGDEVCKQVTDACRRSMGAKERLFSGQRFFLSSSLSSASSSSSSVASNSAGIPSRTELARLIEAGDGQVCTTREPDVWIVSSSATGTRRRSSAAALPLGTTLTVAEFLDHVSRYERIINAPS